MLQVKFLSKALCAVAGVFLLVGLAQAADDLLAQAKALLEQRRAQEAYALLIPQQSKRAGDPNYDYLLGIAALDSGRPGEAVFALERVLAVKPEHLQARAEIARAYFLLKENDSAREEFEAVKAQNPPAEVVETIQKYLSAIDQQVDTTRTKIGGYVEIGYGSDSNVNSATSQSQIAVPLFGGAVFTIDESGRQIKDKFIHSTAGVNLTHPFSPVWGLFTGVSAKQRDNKEQDAFDLSSIDGNLGLRYVTGKEQFSFAYQNQSLDLNDEKYRSSSGINTQWQHAFDGRNMGTLYLQYAQLSYPAQSVRDADQIILGGALAHAFRSVSAPVGFVGLYFGNEDPKEKRPDLAYSLVGLRLGGQYGLRNNINLIGSLSTQGSKYDGEDLVFLTGRRDTRYDASFALEYVPRKQWVVRPEVTYTQNNSNIVINDFKRTEALLSVRYNF